MFRLLHFGLQRWGRWRAFDTRLPGNIILLVGANSSGKTTLIDAIRTLLGIEHLPDNRDVEQYVARWKPPSLIWAVVSNPPHLRRRAFSLSKCHADTVTLICLLNTRRGALRDFYIVDGTLDTKGVLAHIQDRNSMGVRDFQAALRNAGLTPQLKSLFAIEQGDVKTICKREPRRLFEYVIRAKGSAPIIQEYDGAYRTYKEAEVKQQETREQLGKQKRVLAGLNEELEEYNAYQTLLAERALLETQLVQTQYQAYLIEKAALDSQATEAEKLANSMSLRVEQLVERLEKLRQTEGETTSSFSPLDAEVTKARDRVAEGQANQNLLRRRIDDLSTAAPPREETSDASITMTNAAKLRAESQHQTDLAAELEARTLELQARIQGLEKDEAHDVPEGVRRAIGPAAWLGTHLEPEPEWKLAVACILRDEARGIFTSSRPSESAIEMALEDAPLAIHWGAAGKASPRGLLSRVRLVKPLPASVVERLATTQAVSKPEEWNPGDFQRAVTKEGLIVTATSIHAYKEQPDWLGGRKQRLEYLRNEKESLTKASKEALGLSSQIAQAAADEDEKAKRAREWQQWLITRGELTRLEQELNRWNAEVFARQRELKNALDAANPLQTKLRDISVEITKADATLQEIQPRLPGFRAQVNDLHEKVRKSQEQLNALRGRTDIDPAILEEERLRHLPTLEEVTRHYKGEKGVLSRIRAIEENPAYCRDATILHRQRLKRNEVEALNLDLDEREREVSKALDKLKEVEEEYYQFVMQVVGLYRRRLTQLAEIGKITVKVESENVRGFRTLDQAELHILAGFGGKAPAPINTLSGGQKTIASILLVLALSEPGDEEGFFLVDEPYADLDLANVAMVSDFLRATGSQHLITVPTNVNKEAYLGADVQLTLQVQEGDTKDAEPPHVTITRR